MAECHGQAVLIFDYPGYGRSGGKPTEAGCYAAGDAAYDWLIDAQKIAGERIMLYGGSLGGGMATELASRRPHRARARQPPSRRCRTWRRRNSPGCRRRWLVHNRFDNLGKIAGCRGPVFIAHGTADRLMPFAQAERLFAAANKPKRFFPMIGLDHNDRPRIDYDEALRRFFAEDAPLPDGAAN